jgi:hypothetical protein
MFLFESQYPTVNKALQIVRQKVFEEVPNCPLEQEEDEWTAPIQKLQGCYNINVDEDDDPRNVKISETEGKRDIEGLGIELPFVGQPIKIKKLNIGTKHTPKLANVGDYWDDATISKITELLHEYQDLFPTKFTDMKGIKGPMGEMNIPLREYARPIKHRPYRLNPKYKKKVKIELDRMLEAGIIEPIEESEWIIPMVVQDKKSGEIRIFVDLRKLNDACLHDPFPTPFTNEVLYNVGGQEVYSFTDGFSGYHQIIIAKEDRHKTTFAIEWGSFQYNVMPFGLKNAPSTFSRVVVEAFKEFLHKFLEAYFDDWIVFSLLKDHIECLRLMLDKCRKCQISLNLKKSIFFSPFGVLLGHIVCKQGLLLDPSKIAIIVDLPPPTSVRQLRTALGHIGYYRKFIKGYAQIKTPMEKLLKKDSKFQWTEECQQIFDTLKQKMVTTPILAFPDWSKEFNVHVDASSIALGVVLAQLGAGDIDHPIDFARRNLSTFEMNYTTTKRECLAMVYALQRFRHYLLGGHFKMFLDHSALRYLANKPVMGGRICRWLLLFQEYDFDIVFRPGRMNKGPDHLSRLENGEEPTSLDDTLPDAQLLAIRKFDDHFVEIVQFMST